ncbi:HrpA-like helicase [Ordospora colligata]|uniref:RNA helicase n=1 Tax=Ordospora colligata OC4 TaxID=1354746 RepID=A0A0B2UJW8_9MICR|nr:HrpA-like helicase [Ordospora colligata OC4]KHN69653.1 HrpA-like helicase [Ordospora colligata OC4]TBU18794.1 HrpA-like helicase [Ordospora colligata]
MSKKERLLKKYLEKKQRQRSRDELYEEIAKLKRPRAADDACKPNKKRRAEVVGAGNQSIECRTYAEEDSISIDINEDVGEVQSQCDEMIGNTREEDTNSSDDLDKKDQDVYEKYEDAVDIIIPEYCLLENELNSKQNNEKLNLCMDNCRQVDDEKLQLSIDNYDKVDDEQTDKAKHLIPKEYETRVFAQRKSEIEENRKKLPIYYEKAEIIHAVRSSSIVFVQGVTGCGKTTQIPQFLYEGGFAIHGIIGITQPRRVSATSICSRINEEINEDLCGYKIRYESTVTSDTRIKVMTDGVLMKEIQEDFMLQKYSVIIIDEIHERSINIDMLLAILPRVVKMRKRMGNELKLVLMSATGDVDEFKRIFGEMTVLRCPEQSFQVNTFYEEKTDEDYLSMAYERVKRIVGCGSTSRRKKNGVGRGDVIGSNVQNDKDAAILVFLTCKQDIYDLKNRLECSGMDITVLPLHSSLSKDEQSLVFGKTEYRKVILATNIAETSITIADVVFVVDSGRVKNKVMDFEGFARYSIDFITKSSAAQRMGRAGRTGPGVCYRLYSGETYEKFYEFSVPQILRSPLDDVVLFILSLGIRNVNEFPFVSRPSIKCIDEAIMHLKSLGAVDSSSRLTGMGKTMSRYPVESRLARLLCVNGCEDVLVELACIVSLISSGIDIRRAKESQMYFESSKSDFMVQLAILNDFLKSKARKSFCQRLGLNYTSMIEVMKMSKRILAMKGHSSNLCINILPDKCSRICNIIYRAFADRLAVPSLDSYFFRGEEVFISKDSVLAEPNCYVVFESLLYSGGKQYMRNITVLDHEWL